MRRVILALLCCSIPAGPAFAWGQTGHRVTGAVADRYLSGLARAHVQLLLGTESLAQAATWPDDMRSDSALFWQKTASPFHYVTVPTGRTHAEAGAPPEGDAVTALARFEQVLRDPNASVEDKRLALRFSIHIVGDLHQPLHAGRPGDRGGNDFKVSWFGEASNLHSVWDSKMIDSRQLSHSELAGWLAGAITPAQIVAWSDPDPAVWIAESVALRETVYPAGPSPKLSYDYAYRHGAALDGRLSRAGVRIAAYLNRIFG
ncbi:MAG TPA: S1/P1 nuclease [Allosphingosinicella sp.]|nr:S1/P1 nuclease [Allosphingosinicella sp.]